MIRFLYKVLALAAALAPASAAGFSLDAPLGAYMVLQRDRPVRISGTASPGGEVTVVFGAQRKRARAGGDGTWEVTLDPMRAEAVGRTLTAACGPDTLLLPQVVVGEVWLAGGQSNMTFRAGSLRPDDYAALQARATPLVRCYNVAQVVRGGKLLEEEDAPWTVFTPDAIEKWSAVATLFAAELSDCTGVPVGIVHCSHGASTVGSWIAPDYLAAHPQVVAACPPPKPRTDVMHRVTNPSQLYGAMLRRVAGYPLRGVIWYQGESDAAWPDRYHAAFAGLIDCWRELWRDPELPFVFAQLSSYGRRDDRGNTTWAVLREAQRRVSLTVSRTAMAVTCDAGEVGDIHPKDKRTVAHRLALAARSMVYGEPVQSQGPLLHRVRRRGARVVLSFRNTGRGMLLRKRASEFEVCGAEGVYGPVSVQVRRRRIVLRPDPAVRPHAVRYAWSNAATLSVYNSDGLPLSPFGAVCGGGSGW